MMNKKGQVLVAFALLIPIVIMFLGLIVDVGINLTERKRIDDTLNNIISYSLKNKEIITQDLIEENIKENLEYDSLNILLDEEKIEISLSKKTKSVFGNLLKIGINKIEIGLTGNFETGEISRK